MKTYFLNKKAQKDSSNFEFIKEAINGRYGMYAQYYGNRSVSSMAKDGFDLVTLTKEEAEKLFGLQKKRYNRDQKKLRAEMEAQNECNLNERANQISKCLDSEPLEIEVNNGGNPMVSCLSNITGRMIEVYQGLGKATAYVQNNKVIAFHYGHQKPKNAPSWQGVKSHRVELSCTQICF